MRKWQCNRKGTKDPYVENRELALLVGGQSHAAAVVDGPEEDARRGGQAQQPHEAGDRKPYRRRRRHRLRWRDREIERQGLETLKSVWIGHEHGLTENDVFLSGRRLAVQHGPSTAVLRFCTQ